MTQCIGKFSLDALGCQEKGSLIQRTLMTWRGNRWLPRRWTEPLRWAWSTPWLQAASHQTSGMEGWEVRGQMKRTGSKTSPKVHDMCQSNGCFLAYTCISNQFQGPVHLQRHSLFAHGLKREALVHLPTVAIRGRQSFKTSRCASESGLRTVTATHHSNGIWGEQLLRTHGRDIGDVGEDVNEGHERNGDEDGTRKVPVRRHNAKDWKKEVQKDKKWQEMIN